MASWRKHLRRMVADPGGRAYTYEQAATILEHLNFENKGGRGSHRKFRVEIDDPAAPNGKRAVIIGLVQHGSRTLKPGYIKEMVRALQESGLLPDETEENESDDA